MTLPFTVIAQTADFVVLDKAAGVSFHSEDGAGLVVQAEQALGLKLYPVHRLDKVTSGLIILAKSSPSAASLAELFASHKIEKFYLALSPSRPVKKQGWVKGDMAPARRGAWKLLTSRRNPAISYFISHGFAELPFRAFLIRPYTGKTHQIRVALKSVGAPLAGDALYQGVTADRVYLHALALRFSFAGQLYQYFCAPLQGQFFLQLADNALLQQWAEPWQLPWPAYQPPINDPA